MELRDTWVFSLEHSSFSQSCLFPQLTESIHCIEHHPSSPRGFILLLYYEYQENYGSDTERPGVTFAHTSHTHWGKDLQTNITPWWWWFSCQVTSHSCNPTDCSPPGSSVHGIPQGRILEWVAISFSKHYPLIRAKEEEHGTQGNCNHFFFCFFSL